MSACQLSAKLYRAVSVDLATGFTANPCKCSFTGCVRYFRVFCRAAFERFVVLRGYLGLLSYCVGERVDLLCGGLRSVKVVLKLLPSSWIIGQTRSGATRTREVPCTIQHVRGMDVCGSSSRISTVAGPRFFVRRGALDSRQQQQYWPNANGMGKFLWRFNKSSSKSSV